MMVLQYADHRGKGGVSDLLRHQLDARIAIAGAPRPSRRSGNSPARGIGPGGNGWSESDDTAS